MKALLLSPPSIECKPHKGPASMAKCSTWCVLGAQCILTEGGMDEGVPSYWVVLPGLLLVAGVIRGVHG